MSRVRGSTRHVARAEPGGSPAGGSRPPILAPLAPSAATGDPLAGVERVLIDGSNLAFALARAGPGSRIRSAEPAPMGAIVGRIRAAFPPATSVEIVFDGSARGSPNGRLATGMRVSYSGRGSADQLIDEGVAAQLAVDGPAGTWGILVVTDDRGLRDFVRAKGARVAGTAWLAGRLGRVGTAEDQAADRTPGTRSRPRSATPPAPLPRAGTTIGHRRPPRTPDELRRDER